MGVLTENQLMLEEIAQKFARSLREGGLDKPVDTARIAGELSDMGWMAILIPEAHGGIAGSEIDMFLLARAHGFGIPDTPFFNSAVLSASLLADASNCELAERLLPEIAAGGLNLALAHLEHPHGVEPDDIATVAVEKAGGYRLNGVKAMVPDAGRADGYLVTARVAHGDDAGRLVIVHVPAHTPGLQTRRLKLADQRAAVSLRFDDVLAADDQSLFSVDAHPALRRALTRGQLSLVGEGVGAAESALEYAIAHVKERRQFGKPLASFQVIRHRIADMYMMLEEVRAIGFSAADACVRDIDSAQDLVRAAKAHLGTAGIWIVEQAVQVHGAMGITMEMGVGRCLQRMIVVDMLLGDADHHLRMLAQGYGRACKDHGMQPAYPKVMATGAS